VVSKSEVKKVGTLANVFLYSHVKCTWWIKNATGKLWPT
jgi:hypothetical protein